MANHTHRFSAKICRGDCFHRKISGQISSANSPGNLLFAIGRIVDEHDDGNGIGQLDSISVRISRIKPRKKS